MQLILRTIALRPQNGQDFAFRFFFLIVLVAVILATPVPIRGEKSRLAPFSSSVHPTRRTQIIDSCIVCCGIAPLHARTRSLERAAQTLLGRR